jgi:O-antigen/teichoic acid export membrane protein
VSDTPLRRLARTTAGYSLSTLAGPLFTLLLTPVYTRVLAVADYGTVDTLTMLGMLLFLLGAPGITPALTALYYDPQRAADQGRLLASALWASALWAGALGLGVLLAAEPVGRLALGRDDVAHLVRMVAVGLPFGVISTIQATALRLRFAVRRSNALALGSLLVSVAANVLLVVVLRLGSAGVIGAMLATNIAGGLLGLLLGRESLRHAPRPDLMAAVARAGAPLLPAGLASWALLYSDRLFLVRAVSLEQIGVYAIAFKLAALLSILIEPFKSAWGPLSLAIRDQSAAPAEYARVLTYYCAVAFGLALGLSLFAHEVLLLVTTPAYLGASRYVWLLALAPVAGGLSAAVSVGLYLEQRLAPLAWASAAAAVANTLLNLLLIPPYGALGASIATALGAAAAPLVAAAFAQRAHPLPFRWGRAATTALLYLALVAAGGLVGSRVEPLSLGLRALLLLAYLPLLRLLGVLDADDLRAGWRAAHRLPPLHWLARRAGRHGESL